MEKLSSCRLRTNVEYGWYIKICINTTSNGDDDGSPVDVILDYAFRVLLTVEINVKRTNIVRREREREREMRSAHEIGA